MNVVPDVVSLILFPILGLVLLAWSVGRAERIAAAWPPADRVRLFDATGRPGEEIGCVVGGKARAVAAAVARLRVAGVVTYDADAEALVPTGRDLPPNSHPLAAAVLAAVTGKTPVDALHGHPRVAAELRDLDHHVRSVWSAHDVPPRHFVSAGLPVVAFGVAGVAWALVPPFRWYTDVPLVLMALFAVLVGVVHCNRPDGMETVATRELRRVREANAHLDPGMRPALLTYGPAAAALAVGLYDLSVLGSTDPALAALSFAPVVATEEQRQTVSTGSGGDASGCGSADVASCGSGCGSGCGGGCGGCGG
jgi:uncharacterized protein (TIGR04222 family)